VTTINGGSGTDSVTFRNVAGNIAGGTMINIEDVIVDIGADISINGTVEANVAVNSGGQISAGSSRVFCRSSAISISAWIRPRSWSSAV